MDISSLGITGVAAITVICLLIGQAVKATRLDNKWIPIICGVCGMATGDRRHVHHAGVPGHRLHHRGGSRDRQRPGGHRHQSGGQADRGQMMGTVVTYSRKAHGEQSLSANFRVREFACKDGSDKILVDTALVALLQKIRDHFGAGSDHQLRLPDPGPQQGSGRRYRQPARQRHGGRHRGGGSGAPGGGAVRRIPDAGERRYRGSISPLPMWMYAPSAPAGTTAAEGRWLSADGLATFRPPRGRWEIQHRGRVPGLGPGGRSRSSSTRAAWVSMARAWT